jgi:hypothetical protein
MWLENPGTKRKRNYYSRADDAGSWTVDVNQDIMKGLL